jgi:hypothetical protein
MMRFTAAACFVLLLLACLGASAQTLAELRDEHTLALYDLRGGDEKGLADLCGQGSLEAQSDESPLLQAGAGLLFDGKSCFIGPLAPLRAPLTIEALLRLDGDSPGVIHGIFEQFEYLVSGCRMGILGYAGRKFEFQLSDPKRQVMVSVQGKTPLEIGKWYHLAATYDNETLRVFVNGKEDGALAWTGGLVPARGGMIVGYESGPKYFLVGALAYLRISKIARTSFPHGENPVGPPSGPLSGVAARYPDVRAYFFPAGKPFPITCTVTNQSDHPVEYTLRLEAPLLDGQASSLPPVQVKVPAKGQAEASIPVTLERRGMYLPVLVVESGGAEVQRRKLPPFAIVEPLPPLSQVPSTSHFGGQPTFYMPGSEFVGMKWDRFWDYATNWAEMEPEQGRFFWEKTDRFVAEALARGEEILWCLCFTPGWASAIPDRDTVFADARLKAWYGAGLPELYDSGRLAWQYPPKDVADWRRYVAEVVKRYGDRVKHWEVWNEANSGHFLGTPKEYFEVLKAAYETIKGLDPKATVVGIAGCPGWLPFTEEVFKLGGLQYMDALSYHDYAYGIPEVFGCDKKVAETRELMRRYGRVLPMWDTEVGFPIPPKVGGRPMTWEEFRDNLQRAADGKATSPFFGRCEVTRRGQELDYTFGAIWPAPEDRAAKYLVRQFVLEMSEGMERFTVHAGGPISHGKLPLLPGIAHAMMAEALATASFVRRVPAASPTCRVYEFRGDAGLLAVCWTTAEQERLVLLTDARRLETKDLFGNPGEVRGDGKRVVLDLTDSPTYVLSWPEKARVWDALTVEAPGTILAGQSFVLRARVTNTQQEALTGKLRVEGLPDGFSTEPAEASVSASKGKTVEREFTVRVPGDARRGALTASVRLQAAGALWSVSAPLVVMHATACPLAPENVRVDGDLAEWRSDPAPISTASQVVLGKPSPMFEKIAGTWWGPEDLSGKLWFGQGKGSLWVALGVRDDSLTPPRIMSQAYDADCVELFLDGRSLAAQATSAYGPGVVQLLISPPDEAGKCQVAVSQGRLSGIEVAGRRSAGGYSIEARLPLAGGDFPELHIAPGALLGFDVAIDDADDGAARKVQMVWQGSGTNYRDTSLFARLRF